MTTVRAAEGRFSRVYQHWLRRFDLWVLAGALVCYCVLAFSTAKAKAPWVDEGWLVSAPANWAQTGRFGTPSLEPTGSWLNAELTGINQYTYWNFPVVDAMQALWFKTLGFSLFTMRLLSILFGALALISWCTVVSKLSGIRLAGPLAALLLAVDYVFLWGATDGRMEEIACVAFGAMGTAAYLLLRESRWKLSLWLANTCLALALFTHPNGLMPLLSFLFLLGYYDRSRLSWRDLATTIPYFVIALLWGAYILQRPDYFVAQFAANASARGGGRWSSLVHPIQAVIDELAVYLARYCYHPFPRDTFPNYAILIPFICWLTIPAGWFSRAMRRHRGRFTLLCLASIQIGYMTFLVGLKLQQYLVYMSPFFAALMATGIYVAFRNRNPWAWLGAGLAALLVACQVGTVLSLLSADSYHREYLPVLKLVRDRLRDRSGTAVADAYFGFGLGFARIRDDARLGFYTGVRPDLIVEDDAYRDHWDHIFSTEEPEVALYIDDLLNTKYHLIFKEGRYRVYERRDYGP